MLASNGKFDHMTRDRSVPENLPNTGPTFLQIMKRVAYPCVPYVIAVVLCVLILVPVWHLRGTDLTVPLGVASDNNFSQALVANFVRDGHYYVDPLLGAPGEQELYDYPLPHWAHLILFSIVRLFTHNPGLAINLVFFASYPLVALTSLYAFRRLGISTGLAIAGAILYAFIPFHQRRNEGHLILSFYYLVPLMAMVAVWTSMGHELFRFAKEDTNTDGPWITRDGLVAILVCILCGWDNPYYAFFGAALLGVGGLLGWLRHNNWRTLLAAVVLIGVLTASLFIGLFPNILYVHQNGRVTVAQRFPVESEVYALTLIQLLAPVTDHRVPALANWKNRFSAQAVLVNENETAALGVVGAAGLLALLVCLFVRRCPEVLYSISVMNLFCILLGTIGGFGAVFSFLITPQLRCFNRISVYISFFCIAAVLLLLDLLAAKWSDQARRPAVLLIFPSLLLLIGVPDQVPRGMMSSRQQVETQYRQDAHFVRQIEASVPPHSMIFQLPYFPFPETPPIRDMTDYDEMKGYLHSGSLRWSYGAMKGRDTDRWLAGVSGQPVERMLHSVASAGFAGIYIDRYGYADRATALESQLRLLLGGDPIVSENGRLSFFPLDLKAVASRKVQVPSEQRIDISFAQLAWSGVVDQITGVSGQEDFGRWSDSAEVKLEMSWPLPRSFELHLRASAFGPNADLPFSIRIGSETRTFRLSSAETELSFAFTTDGTDTLITIGVPKPTSPAQLGVSGDDRLLGIALRQISIVPMSSNVKGN
jgi:phosphoglycerol transferase